MKKNGLIYIFVDKDKKPFYIGKTIDLKKRTKAHLLECKKGNSLYKYNKLRKILKTGLTIDEIIVIIEENIEMDLLDDREIYYIEKLRKDGYQLTNLTDGGDGGDTLTDNPNREQILKYRKKLRETTDWNQNMANSKKGVSWGSHSKETKRKMSEAKKGIRFSNEHKNKLSIARKKRITTAETKLKMSKTSKGKINIKKYKLTDPNGQTHITTNGLTVFCEKNNLTSANLMKVLKGDRVHHKGWTIERMSE
jgi:group I intron endonuclease